MITNLPCEQFDAVHVQPFDFAHEDRRTVAAQEASETVSIASEDGRQFSGIYLNRDYTDRPAIVRIGSFQTSSHNPQHRYIAYQYAAANPHNQIISIDLPSHGSSDHMHLHEYKSLFMQRCAGQLATAHAMAIDNFLPLNTEEVVLVGDSFGGQAAPHVATALAKTRRRPQMVMTFDMAGLTKYDSVGTALKLLRRRQPIGHQKYHDGPENQRLEASYRQFAHTLLEAGTATAYSPLDLPKRDPVLVAGVFARSPASSHDGFDALEASLEQLPDLYVSAVTGGLSKICDLRAVRPHFQSLARAYPGRLAWDLWPNDGHAMSIAEQQPRTAAYIRARMQQFGWG